MSNYAIVPREPTPEMIDAVGAIDPAHTSQRVTYLEAAPPPPESVLSDEEMRCIAGESGVGRINFDWQPHIKAVMRNVERAVLAKLTEQK